MRAGILAASRRRLAAPALRGTGGVQHLAVACSHLRYLGLAANERESVVAVVDRLALDSFHLAVRDVSHFELREVEASEHGKGYLASAKERQLQQNITVGRHAVARSRTWQLPSKMTEGRWNLSESS